MARDCRSGAGVSVAQQHEAAQSFAQNHATFRWRVESWSYFHDKMQSTMVGCASSLLPVARLEMKAFDADELRSAFSPISHRRRRRSSPGRT